jgi:hypothetical protein
MLSNVEIAAVQMLGDRLAIRDTVHRYCRGVDRHDVETIDSIFFADGIDNHGDVLCYRHEFAEWGNRLHEKGSVAHGHSITTQLIEVHGDEGTAESYVVFVLKRKDGKTVHIGGARYLDRLERRGGLWRIVLRRVVMEWRCDVEQERAANRLSGLPTGTWDRQDTSYRLFLPQDGG